jgi:hypothetical protein
MQDHPNPRVPTGVPRRDTSEHRVQRWVLLELVTSPPPDGDDVGELALRLDETRPDVESAIEALVDSGLAQRDGEHVRATAAALRFDSLWPVRT